MECYLKTKFLTNFRKEGHRFDRPGASDQEPFDKNSFPFGSTPIFTTLFWEKPTEHFFQSNYDDEEEEEEEGEEEFSRRSQRHIV